MIIAIDMMGGDFAPAEAVNGLVAFVKNHLKDNKLHFILLGRENEITGLLKHADISEELYTIVHCPSVIEMQEHPTKALKEKPDSSIAMGFSLLAKAGADAFISAGNTGAMMVGALFSIKTIKGVNRPTIGAYMPRQKGPLGLLVDVGLNADCKPENLNQFSVLGSLYAEHILNIDRPRVGLVNLGEEEGKGNLLCQATYPLLKQNEKIHFIGNVEGRDILGDKADVLVCDGFTGNVVLKMAESIFDITKSRKLVDEYFEKFDFERYGGVPVLGVSKPVIIGHGISRATAFENMIVTAARMLATDLCGKIEQAFASA